MTCPGGSAGLSGRRAWSASVPGHSLGEIALNMLPYIYEKEKSKTFGRLEDSVV